MKSCSIAACTTSAGDCSRSRQLSSTNPRNQKQGALSAAIIALFLPPVPRENTARSARQHLAPMSPASTFKGPRHGGAPRRLLIGLLALCSGARNSYFANLCSPRIFRHTACWCPQTAREPAASHPPGETTDFPRLGSRNRKCAVSARARSASTDGYNHVANALSTPPRRHPRPPAWAKE